MPISEFGMPYQLEKAIAQFTGSIRPPEELFLDRRRFGSERDGAGLVLFRQGA